MARLKETYRTTIAPKLQAELGLNAKEVPKITKITLNMGLGEAVGDKKVIENALADLEKITGRKGIVTYARKSIAVFKIRDGWPIGVKVTLRREQMYEFLDRLLSISLPRVRDFRGLNAKSFDGRGNYSMGVKEQIIFPEIDYDKIDALRGLDITITTSAKNDEEGRALLTALHFPFRKPAVVTEATPAVEAAAKEEAPVAEKSAAEEAPTVDETAAQAVPVAEEAATKQAPEVEDVAADTAEENVDEAAAAKDKEES